MPNGKDKGLKLAKKQFLEDLRNDPDFIEHKKNSFYDKSYGLSYGTVVAGASMYVLNMVGPSSQTLISQFLKHYSR